MTFKEKIHTILRTNTLQIDSVEDLAIETGIKAGTIYKAMGKQNGMGIKNTKILLDRIGINPDWWDTGKGDTFLQKGTDEPSVETLIKKKNPDEQIRILTLNLNRMGEMNEYLLKRVRDLEEGTTR